MPELPKVVKRIRLQLRIFKDLARKLLDLDNFILPVYEADLKNPHPAAMRMHHAIDIKGGRKSYWVVQPSNYETIEHMTSSHKNVAGSDTTFKQCGKYFAKEAKPTASSVALIGNSDHTLLANRSFELYMKRRIAKARRAQKSIIDKLQASTPPKKTVSFKSPSKTPPKSTKPKTPPKSTKPKTPPKSSQSETKSTKPKTPPKSSQSKPKSAKKSRGCGKGKIKNQATGRCVSRTSSVGKRVVAEQRKRMIRNNAKKSCAKGKLRNPATGRCVKKTSAAGKVIALRHKSSSKKSNKKSSNPRKGKVLNPATGRYVSRDGALGKKILKERKKARAAKRRR